MRRGKDVLRQSMTVPVIAVLVVVGAGCGSWMPFGLQKKGSSPQSSGPVHAGTREQWDEQVANGLRYVEGSADCPGLAKSSIFQLPDGSRDEMTNVAWEGWWPVGTTITADGGGLLHTVGEEANYPTGQQVRLECDPDTT